MTMENTINEMKAEVEALGLGEKLEAYAKELDKAVSKFNKGDYLTVLGVKEDAKPEVKKSKEEIAAEKEAEIARRLEEIETIRNNTEVHNKTKVMCVVTDHYTGMSTEDEEIMGRVYRMSYGNKMGSVEVRVRLDGEPQYLPILAINKLKTIALPRMGKGGDGKEHVSINGGKRFSVAIVDGWTEEKLEQMKKAQKVRNA